MRILVPVDGSPLSQAALDFIAGRTTLIGSAPEVRLVSVQWPISDRLARIVGRAKAQAIYVEQASKVIKPALAQLAKAGLVASADVESGSPGEEIAQAAQDSSADLIVMGSHGRSEFGRVLMGSVAYSVLAKTRVPVLLLRGRKVTPRQRLRVGIAVDGSRLGNEAVKYTLRHAELFGADPSFALLHVVSDYVMPVVGDMSGVSVPILTADEIKQMQAQAFETALAAARKLMRSAQVPFTEVKLAGVPGDEIAAYARKQLDLLVMGSHGYGVVKAAALGSVATRVAARGDTPLLLVRRR